MNSRPELKLDWCSHEAARWACEHWHYSGQITRNKLVKIGVWESGDFMGCIIFGTGASHALGAPYGLTEFETCELVRIALKGHKTPVTRLVSIAIGFLKKACPKIRLVVSFADPAHGHHGGIYQGGNWIFGGMSQPSDEYLINGKRMHGRAVRKTMERYTIEGRNTFERVKRFYDPNAKELRGTSKYRYLMPLDPAMRLQIEPLRKPYPKRAGGDTKDTPAIHAGEGGSTPTPALQISTGKKAVRA